MDNHLVKIHLKAMNPSLRNGEPVTQGVPWPKGVLFHAEEVVLQNEKNEKIPLGAVPLEKWSDGSIRWLLCDWRASVDGQATYTLSIDKQYGEKKPIDNVHREQAEWKKHLQEWKLVAQSEQGCERIITMSEPKVLFQTRGRTSFECTGTEFFSAKFQVFFVIRAHFYDGLPIAKIHVKIHNPQKADHPGGLWDLGNGGSFLFQKFEMHIEGEDNTSRIDYSLCKDWEQCRGQDWMLHQASSGGENWKSTNHINKDRIIPMPFRGYQIKMGESEKKGLRATPVVRRISNEKEQAISIPYFWQNFPKEIRIENKNTIVGLFPKCEYLHEIQGGEQKTHIFYHAWGHDSITAKTLEWSREPIQVAVDAGWIEKTEAITYLTAKKNDSNHAYLNLVDQAIDGKDTFEHKREVIDEYGWRHFGDIYGDHEAILHTDFPPNPRASHYNNQYDPVAGFAYQWLRSEDHRWYQMMNELAWHVIDIDLYNTDEDKSAYNHGLFWHTYHYVDADTGTHRSYPKRGKIPPKGRTVPGGGPGNEQDYSTGLMLHYYLTGDEASKTAAIGMANWVIDMDDGSKTIFRWLTRSETGLASQSRSPDYHGPGRGSANSILTLLNGFRLTRDRKYVRKADQIIQRCIHPEDDVSKMNLLDAENRWFYTMFLQAIGVYLDLKIEMNEIDDPYAYAQASLIQYGKWMLENEYLYLSKPELLEYPTETWPAQDMRKSEIFQVISYHVEGENQAKWESKSKEFYEGCINQLQPLPTKSLCRPVVLLLSYGWMRNWRKQERKPIGKKPDQWPKKITFIPQKVIFKKRAKAIIPLFGILFFVLMIGLVYWLLT